jgi:predicted RNA binding protein YcfA (HicA-like mRNA interferase family)
VEEDSAIVRLARLVRVKSHTRNSHGRNEQVDSYVRKNLDPYGPGANAKTRAGAYAAKTQLDKPQPKRDNRGGGKRSFKPKEVVSMIEKRGGVAIRQSGSHLRLMVEYEGGKVFAVVPMHSGRDVATGTLRAIERDLEPAFGERWLSNG